MRKWHRAQNTVEFALMLVFVGVAVFLTMSHIEGPIKGAFEKMAPKKQVHSVQAIVYKDLEETVPIDQATQEVKTSQVLLDIFEEIQSGDPSQYLDQALVQILEDGAIETSGSMANILISMLNSNSDFVSAYGMLDEDQTLEEIKEDFPPEEQELLEQIYDELSDKVTVVEESVEEDSQTSSNCSTSSTTKDGRKVKGKKTCS